MAFNVLAKYTIFELRDMDESFSSDPTPCNGQDNIGIQIKWIGTPTGTFGVQVSNDYYPGDSTNPFNAGTWTDLVLSDEIAAAGSSDNAAINLKQLPFSYYRVVYDFVSGTGLATAVVTHKGI